LRQLEAYLELPMVLLSCIWLAMLVIDMTGGLNPLQERIVTAIWLIFVADFLTRLALAPRKSAHLRSNWLTAVALVVPALRVFRIARAIRLLRLARAARSIRLIRILGSVNRGMRSLAVAVSRRGFGYVLLLTLIVTVTGAAGIYNFEHSPGTEAFRDYPSTLWWTAMLMTTMGSEFWPKTAEGRLLCLLMSVYAFAVFGYVTAAIARFFIAQDNTRGRTDLDDRDLASQVRALRTQIDALSSEFRKRA
jgi:voltage-gated potassium channel